MLLFGHVGNTIALAGLCQMVMAMRKRGHGESGLESQSAMERKSAPTALYRRAAVFIDYRLVVLGSMLPDIIDKPLMLLTGGTFNYAGRGYAHTLLFSSILTVVGLIIAIRNKKYWLLTISLASLVHLLFDQIWVNPTILSFPVMGSIPQVETSGWFSKLWGRLFSDPYVYFSEISGLLITLYVALRLLKSGQIARFFQTGDIKWNGRQVASENSKTRPGTSEPIQL